MIASGLALIGLLSFLLISKRKKKQIVKRRMIDLIGHTPLIYIKSLSEALNCEIYVD